MFIASEYCRWTQYRPNDYGMTRGSGTNTKHQLAILERWVDVFIHERVRTMMS